MRGDRAEGFGTEPRGSVVCGGRPEGWVLLACVDGLWGGWGVLNSNGRCRDALDKLADEGL